MLDDVLSFAIMYFEPKKFRTIVTRCRKGPRKGRKRFQVIQLSYSALLEANPFERKENEETGFAQN